MDCLLNLFFFSNVNVNNFWFYYTTQLFATHRSSDTETHVDIYRTAQALFYVKNIFFKRFIIVKKQCMIAESNNSR